MNKLITATGRKTKRVAWLSLPMLAALAMFSGSARPALAGAVFHEEPSTGVHIAAPRFLESEARLQPGTPFLDLTLQMPVWNRAATDIVVDVRVSADSDLTTFRHRFGAGARSSVDLPVRLPVSALKLDTLNYSGRITASVMLVAENKMIGYAETTEIYFHPDNGKVLLYDARTMRQRHGAGNFRWRSFPEQAIAEQAARSAMAQAGLTSVVPGLARVMRLPITSGGTSGGPNQMKRFCLMMKSDAYWDSSGREWLTPGGAIWKDNYGEDYGINGLPLPMARAWVVASQQGVGLFTGYVDQFGCTPYVPAASNVPTTIMLFPMYRHPVSNLRAFVSDLNLGTAWPQTMPYFQLELPASASPIVIGLGDTEERVQTMYTAAAFSVERFPGGLTNVQYEFRLGVEGNNQGTGTNYNEVGNPMIYVKHSPSPGSNPPKGTTARSKFTISHEYGHAVLMAQLNPPLQASDLDYSVEAGEANQHTMTSKEWQLAAAVEGFAHYIAASIWNEVAQNADAYYVDGGYINPYENDAYALNVFDKLFESNYSPAQYPDQGIEMDWAQFFWNYQTDPPIPGVLPVTQAQIVQMWKLSHPWPVQQGFFVDFTAGATSVLWGQVQFGFPPQLPVQWFMAQASAAGIAH